MLVTYIHTLLEYGQCAYVRYMIYEIIKIQKPDKSIHYNSPTKTVHNANGTVATCEAPLLAEILLYPYSTGIQLYLDLSYITQLNSSIVQYCIQEEKVVVLSRCHDLLKRQYPACLKQEM